MMQRIFGLLAETEGASAQMSNFWETLTTPSGMIAAGVMAVLAVWSVQNRGVKWGLIGLLLFTSTLSILDSGTFRPVLMFPLEQFRSQGRGLTFGLMMALMLPAVLALRGWRPRLTIGAAWAFFVFEMFFCARLLAGGHVDRAGFGLLVFLLTFALVFLGVSRWLQDVRQAQHLVRGIVFGGAVLALTTGMQLLVDPSQVIAGRRLYGMTGNPQALAISAVLFFGPACYLAIQAAENKAWRLFGAVVAGALAVMVLWSGSRTGLIMAIVQTLLLFRLRFGRMIVFVLTVGGVVVLGLQFFSASTESAGRMFSMDDTRSAVWRDLFEEFSSHPFFGKAEEEWGGRESSYLTVAARLGLFGLIPLAASMLLATLAIFKVQRLRRRLGANALLADLVVSGLACLAVGAVFEAYFLGVVSISVFLIYLYFALLAFVRDLGSTSPMAAGLSPAEASVEWEQAANEYEAGDVPA